MASSVYLQDFKERPQAQTEQYDQTLHYGIAEPTPHLPVSDLVDIHGPNTLPAPNSAHDRQSAAISDVGDSYNPYSDSPSRPTQHLGYDPEASLVHNAADYGVAGGVKDYKEPEYMNISTAEAAPLVQESKNPFTRFFANDAGRYPLEQRIDQKRRGMGRQRWPVVAWTLTVVMIAVLIYELVLNSQQQGSPVSFKPVVNPMLGPSTSALIFAGARFPACMKDVQAIPITSQYPCMNDTANPPTTDTLCTFESLCGFGGISANETPNQWWRFITPIFLHAGIIHLLLNMLAQMTAGAQVEREMGSAGFTLVYFAGGIFGNIFGGNFNLVGVPSVGASGALFSTVGVAWVDLLAHWNIVPQPRRRLVFMIIELVLGVAMGFIPYIDNFVHLGGLFMGLIVGMLLYPIISLTPRHKTIVWVLRIASIPVAIVLFVVLIRNFYTSDPYAACRWCRYISCIPTSVNNHCKGTGLAYTTSLTTPN